MNCSDCDNDPRFYCSNCNSFFCQVDFQKHKSLDPTHKSQKLQDICNHPDLENTKSILTRRIELIKRALNDLSIKIHKILKKFEKYIKATLNHFQFIIKNLTQIINEEMDLERLKTIEKTQIFVKQIHIAKLKKAIKEVFNTNIINIVEDKELQSEYEKNWVKFLELHNGGFRCLKFSNDGTKLVSGMDDSTLRIWDVESKNQIGCLIGHLDNVLSFDLAKDFSFIASGSSDRRVVLWNTDSNSIRSIFYGHQGAVFSVVLYKDDKFIISGGSEKIIIIWSTKDCEMMNKIEVSGSVFSACLSQSRNYVAAVGCSLVIIDLNSLKSMMKFQITLKNTRSLACTKSGTSIILGSDDFLIRIFDTKSRSISVILSGHTEEVNSISITEDDQHIISSSNDTSIILWSLNSKTILHKFFYHTDHVYSVVSQKNLIFSASRDSRIGIFSISSKSFISTMNLKPFREGSQCFKGSLVSYGSLNKVCLCDLNTLETSILDEGHLSEVYSTRISSSMKYLVTTSKSEDNNLIVWDLKEMKKISSLNGHRDTVFCVDIDGDDSLIASGDFLGYVKLWSLENLKQTGEFYGSSESIYSVSFTRNKKFLVSAGSGKQVFVWNVESRSLYTCFEGHQDIIWKVIFTASDEEIASANKFEGIKVWSLTDKCLKYEFRTYNEADKWIQNNNDMTDELNRYLF